MYNTIVRTKLHGVFSKLILVRTGTAVHFRVVEKYLFKENKDKVRKDLGGQ